MRVAVVGVGYWGQKHARILRSMPEVAEVVCVDASKPSCDHSTLTAALPEVDAVVLATPARTHAGLAMEAIAAGKHVLVEKPFATDVEDARRMVQAAEQAGVVLMAGHTYTYNAEVQKLRWLIEGRELGHLYYLDSARLNLGLYRPDVSVIWDLAAHDVAIVNYLLDNTPCLVGARAGHGANSNFDDIAYLWLEYDDPPVMAAIHVSWLDPRKVRRLTVVGSERMAVYDDMASDERLRIFNKGVEFHTVNGERPGTHPDVSLSYRYGEVVSPYVPAQEPLLVEDRDFVDCIRTGRTPVADGHSGLAVVEVLAAVDESIRTNQLIHLAGPREGAA